MANATTAPRATFRKVRRSDSPSQRGMKPMNFVPEPVKLPTSASGVSATPPKTEKSKSKRRDFARVLPRFRWTKKIGPENNAAPFNDIVMSP